jgi:hypothetical protein
MKTFYFHISQGLRGCYMPDNSYAVKVTTRKQLKSILKSGAYYIRDAGFVGCSKRAVQWLAAECWRNRAKATLGSVVPYKYKGQSGYPYGLFCSVATKDDYEE